MFSIFSKGRSAQYLAVRAEALARKLNNVPPDSSEPAKRDLVGILQSTCDLLEYLLEQQPMAITDNADNNQQEHIASAGQAIEEMAPAISETTLTSSPVHQPALSATAQA